MATKVNPRSIGVEGPFIPSDPVAARRMAKLLEALEAEGCAPRQVAYMRAWLEAKAAGRPDQISGDTKARYRKIIRELNLDPGPARGRRTTAEGKVELAIVEATGVPRSRARAAAREAIKMAIAPIMYLM
jgi:hypothetical protein